MKGTSPPPPALQQHPLTWCAPASACDAVSPAVIQALHCGSPIAGIIVAFGCAQALNIDLVCTLCRPCACAVKEAGVGKAFTHCDKRRGGNRGRGRVSSRRGQEEGRLVRRESSLWWHQKACSTHGKRPGLNMNVQHAHIHVYLQHPAAPHPPWLRHEYMERLTLVAFALKGFWGPLRHAVDLHTLDAGCDGPTIACACADSITATPRGVTRSRVGAVYGSSVQACLG